MEGMDTKMKGQLEGQADRDLFLIHGEKEIIIRGPVDLHLLPTQIFC